jgi:hypothetical protein
MATSATAHLIVLSPPIIAANPTNLIVTPGTNATFQATVTGSGPLTYQWIFNETNLPGAITNPLVLTNVSSEEPGAINLWSAMPWALRRVMSQV